MMHHVEIFSALATRLETFGKSPESRTIVAQAIEENPWFTESDILRAVEAIRSDMLQRDAMLEWLERYTPVSSPRRVAVIMAGNLPLVGFFDLMCVLLSGNECHYKPSSKDSVLMNYIVGELRAIDPQVAIFHFSPTAEYDMLIATGGDEAMHHFDTHYPTTRRLLRGSRHSVAVLSGSESEKELRGLADDITAYSGLGCRSVSLLFVPRGYRPVLQVEPPHCKKLERNLRSECALRTMTAQSFVSCGGFILAPGDDFPKSLAVVHIAEYDTIDQVAKWLKDNGGKLQCVVSHIDSLGGSLPFGRIIPFGQSQHPTLTDYADGLDTMQWLTTFDGVN
jgi:hypothetical protein